MTLHFQSMGQGNPLIILHGLFGSADNWRGIAKTLSSNRQVISVDLRNHGRSFHHPQQTFELMAQDLSDLLDELGLPIIDLLGHSLGGKVAMQFAQDFTDRLKKMIVVDMAPRLYEDEHSSIFKALLALDLTQFSTRSEINEALSLRLTDPSIRQFLLLNLQKDHNGFSWRNNLQDLSRCYPNMLLSVAPTRPVNVPSLFLSGAQSHYVTEQDWLSIKYLFPRSEHVVVNDAGHWVHADQPDKFVQQVNRFLTND